MIDKLITMHNVVLVVGGESSPGRKITEQLMKSDNHVVVPIKDTGSEKTEYSAEKYTAIPWNPESWFSAKTVIRETIRRFHKLDSVWILHRPILDFSPFSDIGNAHIEQVLENTIKGPIALAREILPVLEETGGFLGFVANHGSGGAMNALSEGAFLGFAKSFIKETSAKIWSCGVQYTSPEIDEFARVLIKLWEDRPAKFRGRWYNHTGDRRLFGKFSNSPI